MNTADRLLQWNRWYDATPENWRLHIVLWPMLVVGLLNMQLTISGGFPFGLLVLLAIIALAAVRVPYRSGWIKTENSAARIEIGRMDWLYEANRRFDALDEWTRFWSVPVVLIVAGTLNIALMAWRGWAFGSLFLFAVLAMIVLRAPYSWKLITPPPQAATTERPLLQYWALELNRWYDAKPREEQFWAMVIGLGVVLAIDLWLVGGSPLALFLLFAAELLVLSVIRTPHLRAMSALAAPQPGAGAHPHGQQNVELRAAPTQDAPTHDEPIHHEPAHHEPAHHEPAHDEPAHDEPAHDEPAHDEPAHDEPAHDEPAHDEPVAAAGHEAPLHHPPEPAPSEPQPHG